MITEVSSFTIEDPALKWDRLVGNIRSVDLAHRAVFLAYKASGGKLGVLAVKHAKFVYLEGNAGYVDIDSIDGVLVSCQLAWRERDCAIGYPDDGSKPWSGTYPTYFDLLRAANAELIKEEEEQPQRRLKKKA